MRKKSNWRKVKVPTPGKLAAHEVNEDIVLSDQDDAFFEEYGQFSSFLTRLNPDELARNEVLEGPRAIMRAKGTLRIADNDSEDDAGNDDSDAEATYEAKPRNIKAGWKENEKTRLPIKGQDGILRMQEVIVPDSSVMTPAEDEATDDSDDDDMAQEVVRDGKQSKVLPSASTIPDPVAVPDKRPRSKGGRLAEAQENLAAIASSIIEDPEKNIGMLKNLRQIGTEKDVQIKKFAFMTQLAVYKDIIPGYRIRQLTEAEKGVKVSKDVKKLRQYEEGLLSNYQAYLQVLESTVQTSLKAKQYDDPLIIIAMQCMADLLTSVTHFNFRLNLMTAIVTRSTVKNPPEVSVICCNALCTLFDNDESGEASLEAVKLLARTIKSKNYNVREEVLKSLLHLKLTHLSGGKDEAGGQQEHNSKKRKNDKDEKHKSRKMRKVEKMNKEVEQEMKEAEATYDKEEVDKRRTETLKFVFLTYFRILKNSPSSTLLPAVLEGLAKFAHLINVEFFADLLNVLKKISFEQYQKYLDGDNTSEEDARSAFHCVIAAFQLLSGQGEALNLDLKDFYTSMYTQLMRLPVNSEASIALAGTAAEARRRVRHAASSTTVYKEAKSGSELELALKGFELLFYKSRMIPVERVASFAKRLATVALHISANGALACLAMIRSLIIRFPRLESLLDAEGRIGTGIYQPLLNDPELTNPFATNLWEMSVFSRHYHPTVRTLAKHVANTQSISQRGATVTNTHKPLPSSLNLPPRDFLSEYDPQPAAGGELRYKLVPSAEVPPVVATALKKKREKGIRYADGPCTVFDTPFTEELVQKTNAFIPEKVSFSSLFEERVEVDALEQEAQKLELMVELMRTREVGDASDGSDSGSLDDDEKQEDQMPQPSPKVAVRPRPAAMAMAKRSNGKPRHPHQRPRRAKGVM